MDNLGIPFHAWICMRMGCTSKVGCLEGDAFMQNQPGLGPVVFKSTSYGTPFDPGGWIMTCIVCWYLIDFAFWSVGGHILHSCGNDGKTTIYVGRVNFDLVYWMTTYYQEGLGGVERQTFTLIWRWLKSCYGGYGQTQEIQDKITIGEFASVILILYSLINLSNMNILTILLNK
ncbi:hypothetical protein BC941DRAFT_508560, partial [Chlamydoabsidia padenii]